MQTDCASKVFVCDKKCFERYVLHRRDEAALLSMVWQGASLFMWDVTSAVVLVLFLSINEDGSWIVTNTTVLIGTAVVLLEI
jgi:hypothetical protein